VARLAYTIPSAWAAFWIKLGSVNLSQYDTLVFYARMDATAESLPDFKIELWGKDHKQHEIHIVEGLSAEWQSFEIPLAEMICEPSDACLDMSVVDELVFTFETSRSGKTGTVYIANIYAEQRTGFGSSGPLLVTDFSGGIDVSDLNTGMGAACPTGCQSPNRLTPAYVIDGAHKGVLKLDYAIANWIAFWIKLGQTDLTPYTKLRFDIRSELPMDPGKQIKLELKRGGATAILYVGEIDANWKTIEVLLSDFVYPGFGDELIGWAGMDEMVFTMEVTKAGGRGTLFLDDIYFVP
jgi:hypothetical protein